MRLFPIIGVLLLFILGNHVFQKYYNQNSQAAPKLAFNLRELAKDPSYSFPYLSVIVENNFHPMLLASIKNIMGLTPPSWPVQILGTSNVLTGLEKDYTMTMYMEEGRLIFTQEDSMQGVRSAAAINRPLADVNVWKKVRGHKMLFFQTDSGICGNGLKSVVEFLKLYDYAGAPWKGPYWVAGIQGGQVGNGGFSIRNRDLLIEIYKNHTYTDQPYEDIYLSYAVPKWGGTIASVEEAKGFSVELLQHAQPMGYHKHWQYYEKDYLETFMQSCPPMRLQAPFEKWM